MANLVYLNLEKIILMHLIYKKYSFGAVLVLLIVSGCSPLKKYQPSDRQWALPEIRTFEELDAVNDYDKDAILFIGSSSIRLWKTLAEDMAPFPVIQRGYGGAHFRDMVFFTDRILADHQLSMVVCFVANDISGSSKDASPQDVLKLFKLFVKQVREKHPTIPILQIAITPTLSRWEHWGEINQVNELIKSYCEKTNNLYYVDTVSTFLNDEGQPKSEWFIGDQLHLNSQGYEVWNGLIKSEVERLKTLD
jgi:hypothetical protein